MGQSNSGKPDRALLKFDLAAAGVPANATIISARLKLKYYSSVGSAWIDRNISAYQMLVDWDETVATVNLRNVVQGQNQFWSAPYGSPGSDYAAIAESSVLFTANTSTGTYQYWDLTALTQKWLAGTAANYGVMLLADNEDVNGHDLRFHSTDSVPSLFDQPYLEVEWYQPQQTLYFLKDHLGSIRATVDDIGQVVAYDDYDPWGMILDGRSMTVQPNLPNKFTGKERDTDFGLNWDYFGARYYVPQIGRWGSLEPLSEKYPGASPYNYTLNSPINSIDLDGERVFFVGGAGNDQAGWNYISRWGNAFSNRGIQGFTRLNVSHDDPASLRVGGLPYGDMSFTSSFRNSRFRTVVDVYNSGLPRSISMPDRMIDKTVTNIRSNLANNPLISGEQLNLAGYSYGAVVVAHAALALARVHP